MSANYDIDHEAESAKSAIRAILARIDGVWDQPDLVAFGPLGNMLDDIKAIALAANVGADDGHCS